MHKDDDAKYYFPSFYKPRYYANLSSGQTDTGGKLLHKLILANKLSFFV